MPTIGVKTFCCLCGNLNLERSFFPLNVQKVQFMTIPSSLLKTMPTGKPSLVQPTLNKIDMEALKRDPKNFELSGSRTLTNFWSCLITGSLTLYLP